MSEEKNELELTELEENEEELMYRKSDGAQG